MTETVKSSRNTSCSAFHLAKFALRPLAKILHPLIHSNTHLRLTVRITFRILQPSEKFYAWKQSSTDLGRCGWQQEDVAREFSSHFLLFSLCFHFQQPLLAIACEKFSKLFPSFSLPRGPTAACSFVHIHHIFSPAAVNRSFFFGRQKEQQRRTHEKNRNWTEKSVLVGGRKMKELKILTHQFALKYRKTCLWFRLDICSPFVQAQNKWRRRRPIKKKEEKRERKKYKFSYIARCAKTNKLCGWV